MCQRPVNAGQRRLPCQLAMASFAGVHCQASLVRALKPALLLVALVVASRRPPLRAQSVASPPWGTLTPGPYRVGFRALLLTDITRAPLALLDGAAIRTTAERGRPMQVLVWYPASTSAPPFRFERYVHELARAFNFAPPGDSARRAAVRTFGELAVGLGGDTAVVRAAVPRLLVMPTTAVENATPARGRFPVVLYPDWSTPATISVLAEYLASHGLVIASTRLKGTLEAQPEISTRGLETGAEDLRFVLGAVDTLSFVDSRRIGTIGTGVAASVALAFVLRHPAVRAFVSLDGGITTPSELAMIRRSPYFDVTQLRAPMLAITAPHPDVDPARLDVYRYAPRRLVHFPGMTEFHFQNFGAFDALAPGIIRLPPGDSRAGFEWASRYARAFFSAHLRSDSAAGEWLRTPPEVKGVPAGLLSSAERPARAPPPTTLELKALLARGGVPALRARLARLREEDPEALSVDQFVALLLWSQEHGDAAMQRAVAELRIKSFPSSARAHFSLASLAQRQGDGDTARRHFTEALRLLPTDRDPGLDADLRARIERLATEALRAPSR